MKSVAGQPPVEGHPTLHSYVPETFEQLGSGELVSTAHAAQLPQPESIQPTSRRAHTARKIGIWIAATTLTVATAGGVLKAIGLEEEVMGCEPVAEAALNEARTLLATPDSPAIARISTDTIAINNLGVAGHPHAWNTFKNNSQENAKLRESIAHREGLTAYNYWPYAEELERDILSGKPERSTIPIQEYISRANAFLAQYDLRLRVGTAEDSYSMGLQPLTKQELDSFTTKQNIVELMRFVGDRPLEYWQQDDMVRDYVLAAGKPYAPDPNKPEQKQIMHAYFLPGQATVHLNTLYRIHKSIYGHENAHAEDLALCGSFSTQAHDPGFQSLNEGLMYTGDNASSANRPFHYETYAKETAINNAVLQDPSIKETSPMHVSAKVHQHSLDEVSPDITFLNGYSENNLLEDKATIGSIITQVIDGKISYRDILRLDCRLSDKFVYLVARLMSHSKTGTKLARYFAALNVRH